MDLFPICGHAIGNKVPILMRARGSRQTNPLGSRPACEFEGCRRVIGVCMRNENPVNLCAGLVDDVIDMLLDRRARIDYGDFVAAEQVRVGAGTGHERGVRCHDTANAGCELRERLEIRTECRHRSMSGASVGRSQATPASAQPRAQRANGSRAWNFAIVSSVLRVG